MGKSGRAVTRGQYPSEALVGQHPKCGATSKVWGTIQSETCVKLACETFGGRERTLLELPLHLGRCGLGFSGVHLRCELLEVGRHVTLTWRPAVEALQGKLFESEELRSSKISD